MYSSSQSISSSRTMISLERAPDDRTQQNCLSKEVKRELRVLVRVYSYIL